MLFCPSWARDSNGLGAGFFRPPPNFTLQHPFNTRLKGPTGPALIALALTAAFIFVPLLGSLTVFILPAPLAYAYYRNGQASFTVTSLIVLALASIVGLPDADLDVPWPLHVRPGAGGGRGEKNDGRQGSLLGDGGASHRPYPVGGRILRGNRG